MLVAAETPGFKDFQDLLDPAGIQLNGSGDCDIRVHNPDLFRCVIRNGTLGLGEAYMDGWWDCDRIDELFCRGLSAGLESTLRKKLQFAVKPHPFYFVAIIKPYEVSTLTFFQRTKFVITSELFCGIERCRQHRIDQRDPGLFHDGLYRTHHGERAASQAFAIGHKAGCLLYTSDAADE